MQHALAVDANLSATFRVENSVPAGVPATGAARNIGAAGSAPARNRAADLANRQRARLGMPA